MISKRKGRKSPDVSVCVTRIVFWLLSLSYSFVKRIERDSEKNIGYRRTIISL